MAERRRENPEEFFEQAFSSLTEEEQNVCLFLSIGPWQQGMKQSLLREMPISMNALQRLVHSGFIQQGEPYEFFREYLIQHKERADAIQAQLHVRARTPGAPNMSHQDLAFLREYTGMIDIIEAQRSPDPKYRLSSQLFHEFLQKRSD